MFPLHEQLWARSLSFLCRRRSWLQYSRRNSQEMALVLETPSQKEDAPSLGIGLLQRRVLNIFIVLCDKSDNVRTIY